MSFEVAFVACEKCPFLAVRRAQEELPGFGKNGPSKRFAGGGRQTHAILQLTHWTDQNTFRVLGLVAMSNAFPFLLNLCQVPTEQLARHRKVYLTNVNSERIRYPLAKFQSA